jgi:hypothetical protein
MAITRAKKVRQLYIKGGKVFPDGRRGFGGGADMGGVAGDSRGANTGLSGGYQGGPPGGYGGGGGDNDNTVTGDDYRRSKKEFEDKLKADNARREKARTDKIKADKIKADKIKADKAKADKIKKEKAKAAKDLSNLGKSKTTKFGNVKTPGLTPKERYLAELAGIDSEDIEGDKSSELQTFNTSKAVGDTPIDEKFTGTLNKREQALQDFLDKRNEVKTFGLSSLFQKPLQKVSDFNASINKPFFTDVIRGGKIPGLDFDMSLEEFEREFDKYKDNRANNRIDAYGNPLGNRTYDSSGNLSGGGDNDGSNQLPPIISQQPITPVTPSPIVESTTSDDPYSLAPRFMGSIFDFSDDYGRTLAADGGMMRMRKQYKDFLEDEMEDPTGGIMDLETGRQQYFLGKLVKKATRAVKKVAKSPIGKAALLYGLGAVGGSFGSTGKFFSKGMFNPGNMMRGLIGAKGAAGTPGIGGMEGLLGKFGLTKGYGGMMPTLKGGIGLGLGIPFALDALGVGKEEEEDGVDLDSYYASQGLDINAIRNNPYRYLAPRSVGTKMAADGGLMRTGYQEGGDAEPVAKKTMPLLDMDGMEKDYRKDGGFVPIGRMERADDVPARLSKNEFVFTADAVRNAGDGDIDKGAEVMYNMMKNLESGGEVSEESQGLDGAREMFQTSQRLEEVL